MLTKYSVFELSRRGYNLLANEKGNNGRELRRFVGSVINPGNLVLQVFSELGDGELSTERAAMFQAYAEQIREKTCEFLHDGVVAHGTVVERDFEVVQNVYALPPDFDLPTASVKKLRDIVMQIVILCDCMHRFAGNPERELEAVGVVAAH